MWLSSVEDSPFDEEGMTDIPVSKIPPNIQLLQRWALSMKNASQRNQWILTVLEFHIFNSLYSLTFTKNISDIFDDEDN